MLSNVFLKYLKTSLLVLFFDVNRLAYLRGDIFLFRFVLLLDHGIANMSLCSVVDKLLVGIEFRAPFTFPNKVEGSHLSS